VNRCAMCVHWKELPGEPMPKDWPPGTRETRIGLCREQSRADMPRMLRLFGAGGGCKRFKCTPSSGPVTTSLLASVVLGVF
jgi:hypothetical protein